MKHRNMALLFWVLSWSLAILGGIWFAWVENLAIWKGIYWALTTVTTVGYGDVTPHSALGYFVAGITMVLTIPIWTIAIAFATSWFTSLHVWEAHDSLTERMKDKEQNERSN